MYDEELYEDYEVIEPESIEIRPQDQFLSSKPILMIGAATIAGVGLGLAGVIGGSFLIGMAAESIVMPSLLLKLAGGLAGGGVGMAKGVQYIKREEKRE